MAKMTRELVLAGLNLDAEANMPMYRQLYEYLQQAILNGRLRPGQRLPATRILAAELGVSRNTVMLAFDDLLSEGYLEGRTGSGTYVTETLPDNLLQVPKEEEREKPTCPHEIGFSQRGAILAEMPIGTIDSRDDIRPFQHGLPALDEFPYEIWSRLAARQLRSMPSHGLSYNCAAGFPPLREAIADYLRTARAVRCEASQVIIVNGAQQALNMVTRLLLDAGDAAWMEDPGYIGALRAMLGAGIRPIPIPINEEGLDVEYGRALNSGARLAYVTPSHQFPLGVTMSVCRRLQLLEWAEENDAWIMEDDYDSEYRYCGRPLSSLQGLDVNERVIYLGTFSKVLFPALRMGYLVVPENMTEGFIAAKTVIDRHNPTFEQMVLTHFIEEGHFTRHIRRMRLLYEARQEVMCQAIEAEFKGQLRIDFADAGMHVVVWLPEEWDDQTAARRAEEAGIITAPISGYTEMHKQPPGLVLGYAGFSEEKIRSSVRRLAVALGM